MAYEAPTVADVQARFPEFATVDAALVGLILAEAMDEVGEAWPDDLRRRAQLYYTAGKLKDEGGSNRSSTSSYATGAIKAETIGPARVEYETRESGTTESAGTVRTDYWAEFLRLRRLAFPTAMMAV